MRAVIITSTAPRHRYYVQTMSRAFETVAVLQQPKKDHYARSKELSQRIRRHFKRLDEAEHAEFDSRLSGHAPFACKTVDDINDSTLIEYALKSGADCTLLYGTSLLQNQWLEAFPNRIINLHLGLSPFYRGVATLLWPFVNAEPECVGATIHLAVLKADAGAILRRVKPELRIGDDYYTLTNRLIREAIDAIPETATAYLAGNIRPIPQDIQNFRASYRKADFDEHALDRMLAFFGNGLTAEQIATARRSPKCVCSQ